MNADDREKLYAFVESLRAAGARVEQRDAAELRRELARTADDGTSAFRKREPRPGRF